MTPGDTVRWRPDISKDRTPMTVFSVHGNAVKVDHAAGSIISVDLLEVAECAPVEDADDSGLLAVIEAQMAAIDDLSHEAGVLKDDLQVARAFIIELEKEAEAQEAFQAGSDEGFREEVERMLGNVCMALGFPREPLVKTGIMELDALVRYVGDQ